MKLTTSKYGLAKVAVFIKEKRKVLIPFCLLFVVSLSFLVTIIPTKNSINGHYYYENNGAIEEEIVLHINNTVEYYIYDQNTGEKKIGYNGSVTRWRCVLNNTEYKEYKEKGFIASPYQIQFCNNNWGSHFQFFKLENTILYSKSLNLENTQKCFIKK